MDISLTLLNYTEEQLNEYLAEIEKSNIPNKLQHELYDLINTTREQIKQAQAMGWL